MPTLWYNTLTKQYEFGDDMKLGYGIEVEQALRLFNLACDRAMIRFEAHSKEWNALDALSTEIFNIISEKDDKYYG